MRDPVGPPSPERLQPASVLRGVQADLHLVGPGDAGMEGLADADHLLHSPLDIRVHRQRHLVGVDVVRQVAGQLQLRPRVQYPPGEIEVVGQPAAMGFIEDRHRRRGGHRFQTVDQSQGLRQGLRPGGDLHVEMMRPTQGMGGVDIASQLVGAVDQRLGFPGQAMLGHDAGGGLSPALADDVDPRAVEAGPDDPRQRLFRPRVQIHARQAIHGPDRLKHQQSHRAVPDGVDRVAAILA